MKTVENIMHDIISAKDKGYDLATIGSNHDMFGDTPRLFLTEVFKAYFNDLTFEQATSFLMQYLAKNHHPHMCATVDSTNAQLWEGQKSVNTEDFLVD